MKVAATSRPIVAVSLPPAATCQIERISKHDQILCCPGAKNIAGHPSRECPAMLVPALARLRRLQHRLEQTAHLGRVLRHLDAA